ncbi:hypothetical protein [Actinacidiphila acididurans]|uniref:DUF2637 domain-containing protein n=1 Tax=Actinacidiphila acididurans TaxID=2784346 RepID=A0ABS2U2Y7_9ACTN|nr:hypothetical protein [Actinacidiphila acididurans]MBM9509957.1 hypothetical protein [Actinacidiphila acididurans]
MTTAPPAPQARPNPADPPAATPRHGGTGLPTITTPPTHKPPAPAEPSTIQQASVAHHEHRIATLEAHAAAMTNSAPTPRPRTTPAPASSPEKQTEPKRPLVDRFGPKVALAAAVGLTASGEYQLAHLVGFPGIIAALLPTAIDVYVIQAMRRHRDVAAALILMVATNALYHLAAAGLFGVTSHPAASHIAYTAKWWLIVAVAAVAPFIVWRIHRITETKTQSHRRAAARETTAETSPRTETTGTETQVSTRETSRETALETKRETETRAPETSETNHRETPVPQTVRETKPTETKTETRSPRPVPTRRTSETTTPTVTGIGDRETEINHLLDLMRSRGGADKVSLDDAITETGRPRSTAAKRLATARDLYAKTA